MPRVSHADHNPWASCYTPGCSKRGSSAYPITLCFTVICRTLMSGGTRIRTGDTMIFGSVRNPTVHRPWSDGPYPSGFWRSPTSVGRRGTPGTATQLWWDCSGPRASTGKRILSDGPAWSEKSWGHDSAYPFAPPTSCDHPTGTGPRLGANSHLE
jgi:hypothetical protein